MRIYLTNMSGRIGCGYSENYRKYGFIDSTLSSCDFVAVYLLYEPKNIFDETLAKNIIKLKKPVVVIDYLEYGQELQWHPQFNEFNLCLGKGYSDPANLKTTNAYYRRLNEFLTEIDEQIGVYFLREKSLAVNYEPKVYPIDYCKHDDSQVIRQSFDEFNRRPLDVFFNWAWTNNNRHRLHSGFMEAGWANHMFVADSQAQYDHYRKIDAKHIMLLLHKEPYERVDFAQIAKLNSESRIVLDPAGCGIKCFRNYESAIQSISLKQLGNLHHAYPWIDGHNCLEMACDQGNKVDVKATFQKTLEWLHNPEKLYEVYKNSIDNALLYRISNYFPGYVMPKIRSIL